MSVNKVILVGRVGRDPEPRTTGGGTVVVTLSVATNERVKRGDQWEDHTEWHRVVAFGRTAENIVKYLKKGRQVYIEGKIRTRKWEDREGQEKYTTEIIADTVQFLGSSPERAERTANYSKNEPDPDPGSSGGTGDEDVPF